MIAPLKSTVPSLRSCVKQPLFITHCIWLCLLQLRFYYFIGALNTYLNRILDRNEELGNILLMGTHPYFLSFSHREATSTMTSCSLPRMVKCGLLLLKGKPFLLDHNVLNKNMQFVRLFLHLKNVGPIHVFISREFNTMVLYMSGM